MAMDYETPRGTENEPNSNELVPEIAAIAAAAAQAGATPLVPGPDNVVVLPAGVTLDDIEVQGRDLVITLDNGQVFVIPEGAIYVPQIVVDGVAVPPMNLAALLNGIEGIEGENFTPEAGPTRSSGGNFADPVNPIGPAFGLGDLLPYTELAFPQQPPRDVIPGRIDRPVNLTLTPGNSTVDEAGLPARVIAGNAEPAGSNAAANSETTTGVIRVNAPDGLASVTVNGTTITAVGQTIVTARGTMTITSIAGNEIGYSYTLADNTSGDNTSDTFNVVAIDTDGDTDAGVITIGIVDDTPTARNDTDAVAPGTYGPESGNVVTGANTTSGAPGADTPGADGITLTGFRGGNSGAFSAAGATVNGTYGTLTFNANGTYTYTRNAGTPGGVNDVFSYQITDSDGDTSTATLTISIGDVQPQANENATVRLDDDALAGGNPGGTGDDTDAANTTGTLGASGGDGPLVWSLATTGAPVGFSYVANGTGIDVFQGTTKVLAVTLNTATGAYTVTQVAPIVHAAGSDENNQAFTLSYTVRDQDNDTANGVISINVDDDTPVTANDTDTIASGTYGPATGNVLTDASAGDAGDGDTGADSAGADGGLAVTAVTGAAAGTIGGTTAGLYGVLTLNADGSYSYARNAGTPGGVNDTFTYTVTDRDGDTATATLTIAIADALPLTGENAQVQIDDDAQPGGNPGGVGDGPDAVNLTGTLAGSGGDGPLTWSMVSFTSPVGFNVTLVNPGLLEIRQGGVLVFSITLNNATGAYTVTQVAPIDQAALGDENNSNFSLGYRVTDQDGDIANGSLSITIDDDTPVVANDLDSLLAGATGPATGNVLTDAAAGDAGDGDTGADSLGADGGSVTKIESVNVPANFDDTADGSGNFSVVGQYGTLTINADGSYAYTRNTTAPLNAVDTFQYTVTDGDGDTATATLAITIEDAGPVTGQNATVLLDDDALAGGNPGGTGDDVDAANVTGTLAGSGGDGALTWAMTSFTSPVGFNVTLVNPGLLEVFQGAVKIFSITLNNATGAYTVVQHAPLDHTALLDENNTGFTLGYRVTDADGDIAGGSLAINIDDDTPVVANDTDSLLAGATGPATGNVLTDAAAGDAGDGDTGADSLGADGGSVTRIDSVNVPANFDDTADGSGNFSVVGQYGTLTINADGSYAYTRNTTAPLNAIDTFTYTVTDGDGDTATATLAITIEDAGPVTGQNLTVQLDDDALAGGNPGGTGDDVDAANVTGTLAGSGGDGALTWAMTSFTSPVGFNVTLVNPGLLEVFQGAVKIFSITLNNATGAYTVVQHAPLDHTALLDENNTGFTLGYRVTDADGDIAGGSLAINIDDDTPVVANDTDSLLAGATGPATGNVLTDASAGDAGDSDTGADSLGADGGSVTRIESVNVPANFDDTADGSGNFSVVGQYGTLTINADGSYAYSRNTTAPLNAVDTFTYTVTDGDGDTATATLAITIEDAGPVTGQNATVLLDDDALAGGNPGGTGDDVDAANVTGTLAGSGGDGALTWAMTSFTSPVGFNVTLVNPGLLEVFQGAVKIFSITLNNATGAYTVVQHAPLDHTALLDENNTGFTLGYRVTDADGDIAGGSLAINIDDDTPVVANDTDSLLAGATGPATGNVLTDAAAGDAGDSDTGADSLGADGGSVTRIESVNVPANFDDTADGSGNFSVVGQYGTLTINADGSYAYTRNTTAPLNAVDTFTYTVTDGDGDTATATLAITIEDAGPVTGQNLTVQLDDDALAGGNPGGTGDDVDAANVTGTLAGSGGDGALAWAMTAFSSPAGFNATLVNPGLLEIRQGTTLVMTITLNNATGAYTVTQNAPIDHTALLDENNSGFSLFYRVTDADGDIANGSIGINIDDDTPVVSNDTDTVSSGSFDPATGNVLTDAAPGDAGDTDTGADSLGADGGSVTGITGFGGAGTIGGTTNGQYGVLTLNADGSYSYVRNAGTVGGVSDVFTYTVTDGDGDTATATLTITIGDAIPITGPNALVQFDDDALAGGNPGGTGDDPDAVNMTGTLAGSGGDGALAWSMVSFTSPVGFIPTLVNAGLLEIRQGATLVFTVTLNNATGAYTVNQIAPIDHTALGNENNTTFSLGYRVTDADGDFASGSLNFSVDDDTPTVTSNTLVQLDDDALGGNPGGPGDDVNTAAAIGTLGHSYGADGAGSIALLTTGAPAGFSYVANGTGIDVFQGATKVLTISLNSTTGAYTVVQNAPIVHAAGNDENNQDFTLNYVVTDGDGDTVNGTLQISVDDDTPVALVASFGATVDEDGLAGGNAGGVGDAAATLPTASGTVTGLFSAGADTPLTYSLGASTANLPALSSGGVALTYAVVGNVLTASAGATPVFTFTLNATTGAWDFALLAPLDHAAGGNENDILIELGEMIFATDNDGDSVQAVGNLIITVDDDTPVAANDTNSVAAGTYGPVTGNVVTNPGTADSIGADGSIAGGPVTAVSGTAAGTIGGTTTGLYGVLTLNADGSYSYTRNAGTPGGVSDVFTYTITDRDGDTATASLVINIDDARPVTAANGAVGLDDDAQAGGNPGGTGDDPDAVNLTGTLAGSGGDGPLTWLISSFSSPGGFTATLVNPSLLEIRQGATLVFTITVNNATGAYTVVQNAAIDHTALGDENNSGFSLGYRVVDQDGDQAFGSLSISVDDDTPVVSNDLDSIAGGTFGPATGNVLTDASAGDAGDADTGADSLGADGGSVTGITGFGGAGTIGGTTNGQYGVLTLNADGSYSYTRNAGTPGGVSDVFTYTVTDGDGDTATATLTIDIGDATPLTAPNAQVLLDDDALAGGNPGGVGDDTPDTANLTGTLSGSGGDGALTWVVASVGSPAGFSVSFPNPGLIEVRQGATLVMTITINTATGAYTVTQNAPIDHAALGDENNAVINVDYVVRDADGDEALGTLSINVDDDTPVVANDTDSLLAGATGPATGNVLTDAAAGDAGDGDTGADSLGADGGSVTKIESVNVPANFDDTADGAGNYTVTGQYGTLTINADGSYSYSRTNGVPLNAVDTFTYTVTDGDGDTATATLAITIADAAPVTGANALVQLDDDALAGGNPGGTGDDPNSVNATGTLTGSGGDGALTWTLVSFTSPVGFVPTLVTPSLVEVRQGGVLVFTITVNNATGAYTVTQVAPIDQLPGGDENNSGFSLGYIVIDADGDQVAGSLPINIDDDTPVVSGDLDSIPSGTYGPATGNVLTDAAPGDAGDGDTGADSLGADGGSVTAITGFGGAGTIGGTTNGEYGVLTLNADGSYSYTRNAGTPGGVSDTFTYTVTDGDGDTASTTLVISIDDATPVTAANVTVLLDDDALAGGNAGGTGDDANAANTTGTLAGSGGDGPLAWSLSTAGAPAGFSYVANGTGIDVFQGATKVLTVTLNAATGAYTVVQNAPIQHAAGGDENNQAFSLSYTVTDQDSDTATGTLSINVDDDTAVVANDLDSLPGGSNGPATGNVLTDASPGDAGDGDTGADSFGADGGSITAITGFGGAGTVGGTTTGQYGVLTLNADGSYSYTRNGGTPGNVSDVFTYTVTDGDGDTAQATLTITISDAAPVTAPNLTVLLDDDALAGGIAGGTGDDVNAANTTGTLAGSGGDGALTWAMQTTGAPAGFTYVTNGTGVDVFQGATKVLAVTLNAATGAYTVTQVAAIQHAAGGDENNQAFTLNYSVTDTDGDSAAGTLAIDVDDDSAIAVAAKSTTMNNAIGATGGNFLDADNDVDNNYGADGAGKVFFTAATITSLQGQNLTSGLVSLNYALSAGDTVLTATRSDDNSVVFTVKLQPTGSADQYTVDIAQKLDSTAQVDFNSGGYNFVGGNGSWAAFTNPIVGSQDILLTPMTGGVDSGTVNANANEGGVSSGGSVGQNESMRVDFVIDVTGAPNSGADYAVLANQNHSFSGHYVANGANALITGISPGKSTTVIITARDDIDNDNDVGDGNLDTINKVSITNGAVTTLITSNGTYVVNGVSYTVTFSGGLATISGVVDQTRLGAFTATGYNSIEFGHNNLADNTNTNQPFKVGDFGATTITNSPVNFTVPISIQDSDGDTVSSGNIAVTLNPSGPPVVLDLNGDGVNFLSTDAGVSYDYGLGHVTTAWVAADDGILAIDGNGDGAVSASEMVFGTSSLTDLQGLAAGHDSNADGVLDASDADFASFGVWQDADSDGVTDAGEFRSLTDLGITSIALASDGKGYTTADGDVIVNGQAVYTRADGTTGTVADAAFAIIEQARQAARTTELAGIAAATSGFLASTALAAAMPASDGHQAEVSGFELGVPQVEAVDAALAPAADGFELDRADFQSNHDAVPQLETAGHDWADGMADALARIDMGSLTDRIAEMAGSDGSADRFAAIADAIGGQFSIGSGSLQAMDALLVQGGNDPVMAINPQDLPALETAFGDTVGDHLVDAIVDHFAANDAGPGNWVAPASDFALQGLLDTAVGESPSLNISGADLARMMFNSTELADMSHGQS